MTKRGRKRRIVKYGGMAPGWYVWDHIEEPPFLVFVGRYRTRAGARAERESDRVGRTEAEQAEIERLRKGANK